MAQKTEFARKARSQPRVSPPGVMARVRGTGGNHTRIAGAKYEDQANQASERTLRGEQDLARRLSPAPAASLRATTSVGRPLPPALRSGLEAAFGADLSAVRIHDD